MELHPGERVVFEGHPSWRALIAFYLKGALGALGAAALAALVTAIAGGVDVPIVVAVFVVGLAIDVLTGWVLRVTTTYAITNQRLHIRSGLIAKREQQTRFERVQNVNTTQSAIQRLLRVGDVDFDTAGSDDSEFRFAGVNDPVKVVTAVDRAQREHEAEQRRTDAGAGASGPAGDGL